MSDYILELSDISKSFSGVTVLSGINLQIEPGKVYVIAGENGAGKSTLCNIISGNLSPSSGTIKVNGVVYDKLTLDLTKGLGIRMVHQELQVLPDMSVAENIYVGNEVHRFGWIRQKEMFERTKKLLDSVGLKIHPKTLVKHVDIAARQLVEIARANSAEAKLIILDEPTSSLSEKEVQKLFEIIRQSKEKGCSFLFISHRIEELLEIGDEVIVLKDGSHVANLHARETTREEIICNMVGRNYSDYYNRKRSFVGNEALRIENLSGKVGKKKFSNAYTPQNINLHLDYGEVLGIAGLVGAGRTEIVKILFGEDEREPGCRIYVDGKQTEIKSPAQAMKKGIVWATEDRKNEGLVLDFSIKANIVMPNIRLINGRLFANAKKENAVTDEYMQKLRIKAQSAKQIVKSLSGGNQQKVVMAKWLANKPKIFIMDEPTRGIDVGVKTEIYKLINQLTAEGNAVLLISSELPEVIGMSDRILVMYEGKLVGELNRDEFSEEEVMNYATGRKNNL